MPVDDGTERWRYAMAFRSSCHHGAVVVVLKVDGVDGGRCCRL